MNTATECGLHRPFPDDSEQRSLTLVIWLSAIVMVGELVVGYKTRSLALSSDGWHMATHVGALAISRVSLSLSRRYASDRSFAFGTGKIDALAGFLSGLFLAAAAALMALQGASRLIAPEPVQFADSFPVAVLGLVVNLASFLILERAQKRGSSRNDEHGHDQGHSHGHSRDHHAHDSHGHGPRGSASWEAAVLHIASDTLTSILAIVAILAGRQWGILWLDSAMGLLGGFVVLRWSFGLIRKTSSLLIDRTQTEEVTREVTKALEGISGIEVVDLHVWSAGNKRTCCVLKVRAKEPTAPSNLHRVLEPFGFIHLTVEVNAASES